MMTIKRVLILLAGLFVFVGSGSATTVASKFPTVERESKRLVTTNSRRLDAYVEVEAKLVQISDKIVQVSFRLRAIQREILAEQSRVAKR